MTAVVIHSEPLVSPGFALEFKSRESKYLAVDDEAGSLRDLVVERLRGLVGFVRLPVDARRSGLARAPIEIGDEGSANSLSTRRRVTEEIQQIADGRDRCCRAMEKIMRQSDQPAAAFGDQCMHRLISVEEADPRHLRDLGRQRGLARAAVERVVS